MVRHRPLEWSDDGSQLAVGLRPAEPADGDDEAEADEPEADDPEADAAEGADGVEEAGDSDDGPAEEPELPGVQIWHTSDVRLYPAQKVSEQRDARRTLLSVWHLDAMKLVPIATDMMEQVELLTGWSHGVERVSERHIRGERCSAARTTMPGWSMPRPVPANVCSSTCGGRGPARAGRYLLSFDGEDYWSYRIADGTR